MIVLNTEMAVEPHLTAASLIHHLVDDLLVQHGYDCTGRPEVVDLAVIITGLGVLQCNFRFVQQGGEFWDSTLWEQFPRPFLDGQGVAYTAAVAAWVRNESNPEWDQELPLEIQRPMRKSLKYLEKSGDCFFRPSSPDRLLLQQSPSDWLQMAGDSAMTTRVIATRHLQPDEQLQAAQQVQLLANLQDSNRAIVLHSISAIERLALQDQEVTGELRLLTQNRDDEIRAKAMIALAQLGLIDDASLGCAARMIDSSVKHVVFAGILALATRDSIPDDVLRTVERGLMRALQTCDYEFVQLFVAGLSRWLEDPRSHLQQLLQQDRQEYLEIVEESLSNALAQSAPPAG